MQKPPKLRCAIYTRKSHEEGLDQEFNSLDAQRVAAEAYIQSQMHEGWEAVSEQYDDGGHSGGSLERPALQTLLRDIELGKIDVIVVYKVDRLSRSLMDFAKLVDVFDRHNVSFVSVTQQFNTTNSMGRLTLNILLSFAQFEREVTGERIRDKFAASKKKGIWMGGVVPLGYVVRDRKLVIVEDEAKQIRHIFEKYLELASVERLRDYLREVNIYSKRTVTQTGQVRGGKPISLKGVCTILKNVLYHGKLPHKGEVFEGEHEAIIEDHTWNAVQELLERQAVQRACSTNRCHDILFKGKTVDDKGNKFTTKYSQNGNRRHHYYVNVKTTFRVGVHTLNELVKRALYAVDLTGTTLPIDSLSFQEIQQRYKAAIYLVMREAVSRIVIGKESITILLDKAALALLIMKSTIGEGEEEPLVSIVQRDGEEYIEVTIHTRFQKFGRKRIIASNSLKSSHTKSQYDPTLIDALVRSYKWNKMLDSGEIKHQKELAVFAGMDKSYVGDVLRLKYLSPEITTMILNGQQPEHLTISKLTRKPLPADWSAQKQLLQIQ